MEKSGPLRNGKHEVFDYALDENRQEVKELYDLDSDISETTNLAEKYPEKVSQLKALMKAIEKGSL
ncbi:MAG: hypothetical protein ISS77_08415 [Phycisphaerae bacterium]|nr:hypothetical protein [Phycisphaerae bacterium]